MKQKQILLIVLIGVMLCAGEVRAQNNVFSFFDTQPEDKSFLFEYQNRYFSEESVEDQNTDFEMWEHDYLLRLPVYQWTDGRVGFFTKVEHLDMDTEMILPDTGRDFPQDLYDLQFGFDYNQEFDNGWTFGSILSTGSASDKLFDTSDEFMVKYTGYLTVPSLQQNRWIFLLNYSNNRSFLNNIPIPGMGYLWNYSEDYQFLLGFPFLGLRANPVERVKFTFSYIPVRNIVTELSYQVCDPVELFTNFTMREQHYLLSGRRDDDDRLFFYEKRASAGFRYAVCEYFAMELSGGFAFDRYFFEGEDFDDRHKNRVDIDDGWYSEINATFTF